MNRQQPNAQVNAMSRLLEPHRLVPMAILVVCAALWPRAAAKVLTAVAAMVALFVVAEAVFRIVAGHGTGPAGFISVFAVAVPLGVLGLRQPLRAGWLLLVVGTLLAASLSGAALTVAVPVMLIGGLFLLAGYQESRPGRSGRGNRTSGPADSSGDQWSGGGEDQEVVGDERAEYG
jgi:hypothetical protein